MHRTLILALLLVVLVLAACAEEGSAPDAIESYLKAKVASDADKLVNLACKDWEAQANADALSFKSVKAELNDMSCKENGKDGKYTLVTCEGEILAEYDSEERSQSLSETTYLALEEDGEWTMCGEQ